MSAEPLAQAQLEAISDASPVQGEMTLLEHLRELRNRVLIAAVTLLITTALCAVFWERIVELLIEPARAYDAEFTLKVFSPTELIFVVFKVALYGGLILASPMWVYQLVAFVLPGLTPREKRIVIPGLLGVVVFLAAGMAFSYWIILPTSLKFLLGFGNDNFDPLIGTKQYMDFVTRIIFWVGLSFEMPMVIALLAKLGIVRARQLIRFWRYAIVIVFIVAAIVTPTPDPLTQTFVAGPLLVLYVVGILFAWALQPKQRPTPVI